MSDEDRMVTSDEEEDDENEGQGFNIANFLFGNVDSHGQLEGDVFDEVWLVSSYTFVGNYQKSCQQSSQRTGLICRTSKKAWAVSRTHKGAWTSL